MREGELWWFDNKALHEAMNLGSEDRIHLIFDVLGPQKKRELEAMPRQRPGADPAGNVTAV